MKNVRAQVEFPSHRRHCVSVRGRLGEWLHQYFGVCSSSLSPSLCALTRSIWILILVYLLLLSLHISPTPHSSFINPKCVHLGSLTRKRTEKVPECESVRLVAKARQRAASQETLRKCNRNAKQRVAPGTQSGAAHKKGSSICGPPPPSKVGFGDPERDMRRCQWGDYREIRSNLSLNSRLE